MTTLFFYVVHLELMNHLLIYVYYLLLALAEVLVRCFTEPNRVGMILNPPASSDADTWFHFLMFLESYF